MDIIKINAALANKTRLDIMRWLKNPDAHFTPHISVEGFGMGVCVGKIHEKCGLSQSTASHYLSILQDAELVIPTRIGKWTYYKRNETTLESYFSELRNEV
jgi:DNA-binding transcriptional ArsR family regulator